MKAKKIKIASVIITYNRIDEAKAQIDIIKKLWQPMFSAVDIYHEYNGKKDWYPRKYKEDFLYRHATMSHFDGAKHMINQGIKHVLKSGKKYDYIVVTSADVWFYNPTKFKEVVLRCHRKQAQLATSLWYGVILSTEFFIITPNLAKRVFPLHFSQIIKKLKPSGWTHFNIPVLESIFTLQVMRVLKDPRKIMLIPGRKAVWLQNRFSSANFYASHHDRYTRKKELLPQLHLLLGNKISQMPSLQKFLFIKN